MNNHKEKDTDMYIKIQKGSPDGVTDNKGSCRKLAEYINHEDAEREAMGLSPFPYTDPDGNKVTTEDVIRMIDGNAKGLAKNDNKFFHFIVAPSPEEIQLMGEDDEEVYANSLYLIKLISRAYAQNFHREGILGDEALCIYWKPHFFRGNDGYLQFHIHAIVSRYSKEVNGKKQKISPLTTHRGDVDGPIKGGFDRKAFIEKSEKLFDHLFSYEREVANSFDYQNTLAHGTVEEKAAQADRLAMETLGKMKESIAQEAQKKHDLPEMDQSRNDNETLAVKRELESVKKEIMDIFHSGQKQTSMFLALGSMGITCTIKRSSDGIEGLSIEKGGVTISAEKIYGETELRALMTDLVRITGENLAEEVREKRARLDIEKEIKQRKRGGPKMKR